MTDSLVHSHTVERLADAVTVAAFIADIHSRVPRLCGQPVRYSSKTFTPTVGRTPHATLSSQPTHRAHVPSHSASLGGQLVYTQQCGPHLSSRVPNLVNRSSNPGHINTDVVHRASI